MIKSIRRAYDSLRGPRIPKPKTIFHKLPLELIGEIISQACNDTQSLLSWSLVSHACNRMAIPHLFHTLRIRQDRIYHTPEDLCTLLESRPCIQPFVKRIHIFSMAYYAPAWVLDSTKVSRLMDLASNLKEFRIQPAFIDPCSLDSLDVIAKYKLDCLHLNFHVYTDPRAVLQVLSLFHTIGTLILQNPTSLLRPFAPRSDALSHPRLQVESIVIGRMQEPAIEICRDILRLDERVLRSLSFAIWEEGHDNLLILLRTYADSLEHLEINFARDFGSMEASTWKHLTLAKLQTVSFIIHLASPSDDRCALIPIFLSCLPKDGPLHSISLFLTVGHRRTGNGNRDWYAMIDSECQSFTALRSVRLIWVNSWSTQGTYTQNAADGSPVLNTLWNETTKALLCEKMPIVHSLGLLRFQ